MIKLGTRIPLQISEGRLILTCVIKCESLRIYQPKLMNFVIDTGSPDSYLSGKDVKVLQVPLKGRSSSGEVDFGGSRFKHVSIPKIKMYLLKEGKQDDYVELNVNLKALKTTRTSERNIQVAESLPSILGMDFLKDQKLSLHVILAEDMAYLQQK